MKSSEIREAFLAFFEGKGHTRVASSSLVPHEDPTLLFTNAGMNQFKDVFLGFDKRPYTRATSSQKCVRAGGKHNDLENVGYTARHHTFFEMLGNFSFGDYFKRDAIRFAWEFLTSEQWLQLPVEKLWVTVYAEDDEAYDIWNKEVGVPAERIIRIGDNKGARYASDNFWMMGDTGPCGPCTEIFFDHGPDIWGGPPGSPEEDGDRYIEIWNNVFMQFNRDEQGTMHPLPKPSVDTGMGLERISAVLQHVHSNYEIDLFQKLIAAAARETKTADLQNPSLKVLADHIRACSFLIADGVIPGNEGRGYVLRRIIRRAIRHGYKLGARNAFFYKMVPDLVAEMGVAFAELKTSQRRIQDVLRQEEERFFETIQTGMDLLDAALGKKRFAQRFAATLYGLNFDDLAENQRSVMIGFPLNKGPRVYFDLLVGEPGKKKGVRIFDFEEYSEEEIAFQLTKCLQRLAEFKAKGMLDEDGPDVFEPIFISTPSNELPTSIKGIVHASDFGLTSRVVDDQSLEPHRILNGKIIFTLYDTHGFPPDLTADICRERGVAVDMDGFNSFMDEQRAKARGAGKFKMAAALEYSGAATKFLGYDTLEVADSKVIALYRDGSPVDELHTSQSGVVVLDNTPFYAESGGQVGDSGELLAGNVCTTLFAVDDTQKIQADVFGHRGEMRAGSLRVGDMLIARVDADRRASTMRNHSATHLLHKALRTVLGEHVQQKGSQVDADKTRFDFAHNAPLTKEELRNIEFIVNHEIVANARTQARVMPLDEAQQSGAMMLFGEKYGDEVRVLDIGTSRELCGGTHVSSTGDIGLFKIVAESGVAAGVRRIEAITGINAVEFVHRQETTLGEIAGALKAPVEEAPQRVAQLLEQLRTLEKEQAQARGKLASAAGSDLASQAKTIAGVQVLAAKLDGADAKTLRDTVDQLKNKLGSAVILLAAVDGEKVMLIAGVTADLTGRFKAGELLAQAAAKVGGKGGGRPDLAQGGGTDAAALPAALALAEEYVQAAAGR
jgi:alanyl-tRNA synthetase